MLSLQISNVCKKIDATLSVSCFKCSWLLSYINLAWGTKVIKWKWLWCTCLYVWSVVTLLAMVMNWFFGILFMRCFVYSGN